jgi:hypothetical protein
MEQAERETATTYNRILERYMGNGSSMALTSGVTVMNESHAKLIANDELKYSGRESEYSFDSCEFIAARSGKYATPARWVVRYQKTPSTDGSVMDDGDELFVVKILSETGNVEVSCGF